MSQNIKKIEQVDKLDKAFYDKHKTDKQIKAQKSLYLITTKEAKKIDLNHE